MPQLNIDDFKALEEKKLLKEEKTENSEIDVSLKELERKYIEKIQSLENTYKKLIEEERKKAFEEGYKKAKSELEKQYKQKLEEEIKKALEAQKTELKNKLNSEKKEIETFLKSLKDTYIKKIDFIDELILSSLEEILYYMYIDPSNYEFLAKEIKRIIIQLKNSSNIKLFVSPSLEKFVKDLEIENLFIEIDEKLKNGDFIIEFDHVQIEANFKEKVKILKDEIKREIKKHTKI